MAPADARLRGAAPLAARPRRDAGPMRLGGRRARRVGRLRARRPAARAGRDRRRARRLGGRRRAAARWRPTRCESLTGAATFFCAVGDDARGARDRGGAARGRDRRASPRMRGDRAQRRTLTWLTADHERTITTLGPPLEPLGADPLDVERAGGLRRRRPLRGRRRRGRARRARRRCWSPPPRTRAALLEAGVQVDALVGCAGDPTEPLDDELLAAARPRWVVRDRGRARRRVARGGAARPAAGPRRRCPAAPVDAFGCGDAFAAALMAGAGRRAHDRRRVRARRAGRRGGAVRARAGGRRPRRPLR